MGTLCKSASTALPALSNVGGRAENDRTRRSDWVLLGHMRSLGLVGSAVVAASGHPDLIPGFQAVDPNLLASRSCPAWAPT